MAMWSWKQRGPFYRRAQAPQSFWSNNKDPEKKPRINLNPSESIHQNPGFETSFDSRFRFRDLLGSAILAENLPAAKATRDPTKTTAAPPMALAPAPAAEAAPPVATPLPEPAPSNGGATAAADGTEAPVVSEAEEAARTHCLGSGEAPFSGEEAMLRPAAMPGLHVQLFRRLQAKWQCYDAYCRVCMALGVNQILQGLTYYAIVHTLVENRSPSCGYALLVIFQAAALAVAILDISGLRRRALLAVQAVGTLPATLAALAVHSAERNEAGVLDPGAIYYTSPAMFFLQACWLELLLWVAKPSQDDAALPRRFRTVLFLDVFGDGVDPTDAEIRPNQATPSGFGLEEERLQAAERVAGAEAALAVAAAAVKRWEAAPRVVLSETQSAELTRIRIELQIWRRALKGELAWRAAARGLPHEADVLGDDSIRSASGSTGGDREVSIYSAVGERPEKCRRFRQGPTQYAMPFSSPPGRFHQFPLLGVAEFVFSSCPYERPRMTAPYGGLGVSFCPNRRTKIHFKAVWWVPLSMTWAMSRPPTGMIQRR
ncbi:unnamed protein product [Durusdinium trenchii]|uniref:Solute carrier family 40 protein n=1 Tax=Durusdinium trenchii TaxID=1381693 RepID=A0ABP0M0H4_9DINO